MIQEVRPKYEVSIVSSQGHVSDIHVRDYTYNIRYIVEVKNKKHITKDDLTKFDNDMQTLHDESLKTVGLFISINSDTIPSIGFMNISKNKVYLTKEFINHQCLNLIFEYITLMRQVEIEYTKLQNGEKSSGLELNGGELYVHSSKTYVIPPNVYSLIANLKSLDSALNVEIESLTAIKHMNENSIIKLENVLSKKIVMQHILKEIFHEFSKELDVFGSKEEVLEDIYHDKLRKWLREKSLNKIKKGDILKEFPVLATELSKMKMEEIIKKYR